MLRNNEISCKPAATEKNTYQCMLCGDNEIFSKKSRFLSHMKDHKRKVPYQCMFCQKTFTTNVSLKKHVLMHKMKKSKPTNDQAQVPGGDLENKRDVQCTSSGDAIDPPEECHICSERFTYKHRFAHMKTHCGSKRPYQCALCDQRFSLMQKCTGHIAKHTGEMPYKCNVCQKSFTLKSYLHLHMRTHIGSPHKSPRKGMKEIKAALSKHMNKFTAAQISHNDMRDQPTAVSDENDNSLCKKDLQDDNRKLKKKLCSKNRNDNSSNIHKNTKNSSNRQLTFQCGLCDRTYVTKLKFKKHMLVHALKKTASHLISQ